jgi:hypothetical protein
MREWREARQVPKAKCLGCGREIRSGGSSYCQQTRECLNAGSRINRQKRIEKAKAAAYAEVLAALKAELEQRERDEELLRQEREEQRKAKARATTRAYYARKREETARYMAERDAALEVEDLAERARMLASNPQEEKNILDGLRWRQWFEEDRQRRGIPPGGIRLSEMSTA